MQELWAKVRAETSASIVQHDDEECQFALVLPTHLNTTESTEVEALSPEAREQYYENSKTAAIALWGPSVSAALVPLHGSASLLARTTPHANSLPKMTIMLPSETQPKTPSTTLFKPQIRRLGFATREAALQTFLAINHTLVHLEKHLRSHPENHSSWKSPDKDGNTIAHIGVRWPKALEWLLEWPMYINQGLYKIWNHEGETPAELLESTLKEQRVRSRTMNYTTDISDHFQGYGLEDTHILLRLQGKNDRCLRREIRAGEMGMYVHAEIAPATCLPETASH